MKKIGVLHVITDTVLQTRFTHAQLAELAIEGGADTVQFRQKRGTTRELIAIVQEVQAICMEHTVPLIVNDRVDITFAVGAAGTHLGQEDMPVGIGRRILSAGAVIGASARTEARIVEAISEGADYIGYGPIYETSSKLDTAEPRGLAGLRRICEIAVCPVIAIGGITVESAGAVIRAGAHGIAVISAVCGMEDPLVATRQLWEAVQQAK